MRAITLLILVMAASFAMRTRAQTYVDDPFEGDTNDVLLGGLQPSNWVDPTSFGFPAHAGDLALLSANGNAEGYFPGVGIEKDLGGSMEDMTYDVSFWIAKYYEELQGVEFADFVALWIGGPDGSMVWLETPTPSVTGAWVQWKGTYHPAVSEIGSPFRFRAELDLSFQRSVALDGRISVKNSLTDGIWSAEESRAAPLAWPVPADRFMNVSLPEGMDGRQCRVRILNDLGQEVREESGLGGAILGIHTETLPSGNYMLLIEDMNGRRTRSRLVVRHGS